MIEDTENGKIMVYYLRVFTHYNPVFHFYEHLPNTYHEHIELIHKFYNRTNLSIKAGIIPCKYLDHDKVKLALKTEK